MEDLTEEMMEITSPTFYNAFIGEYVQLTAQFRMADEVITTYEAFLLDVDADYYFLSADGTEVTSAIKRSTVFSIEIFKPKSKAQELLESFNVDNKEEN